VALGLVRGEQHRLGLDVAADAPQQQPAHLGDPIGSSTT
jgi:hypothetical protein